MLLLFSFGFVINIVFCLFVDRCSVSYVADYQQCAKVCSEYFFLGRLHVVLWCFSISCRFFIHSGCMWVSWCSCTTNFCSVGSLIFLFFSTTWLPGTGKGLTGAQWIASLGLGHPSSWIVFCTFQPLNVTVIIRKIFCDISKKQLTAFGACIIKLRARNTDFKKWVMRALIIT